MASRITRSDAEWRARLTPLQYIVTRKGGNERAFSASLPEGPGQYACRGCDARLFPTSSRFDTGRGRPAFREPLPRAPIATLTDRSWMKVRTAVQCARCGAHLGYLAGAEGAGYYELNAESLKFLPG